MDRTIQAALQDSGTAARYPDAAIEHVLEDRRITVQADGTYTEVKRETIRILNRRGQDSWSESQEGFDADHEVLELNWARTITPSGTEVPVASNAIKDAAPFSDYPAYDHFRVKTWSYPATMPGAVLDYQVTLHCKRPLLDRDFADHNFFGDFQPARLMRYQVSLPRDRRLSYTLLHPDAQSPLRFAKRTVGDRIEYSWEAQNVGFTLAETSQPPWQDLLQSVWVTTVPTWEDVNRWWRKMNAAKAAATPTIRSLAAKITAGLSNPDAKARAIYDWVVNNIRYVYVDMNYTGFETQSAEDVLNHQYGDCKGGSTLLMALLEAAGVPAYHALIRTNREGPLIQDSPGLPFDHCIVAARLPKGLVFLDNVGKTVPYGTLPGMDQGAMALVVFPDGPQFVPVPQAEPSANLLRTRRDVALDASGGATVSVTLGASGVAESPRRESYQELSPAKLQEAFEARATDEVQGAKLVDFQISDPHDLDTPLVERYRYVAPEFANRAGDLMIMHMPGFDPGMANFERETRRFPMWWETRSASEQDVVFHLPAGWRVRYLPADLNVDLPQLEFTGTYRQDGGDLRFHCATTWKARELPSSSYRAVRELLRRRSLFGKELVVLQSISGAAIVQGNSR